MRQTAFPVGSKTSSKPAGVADRLQLNAMSLLKFHSSQTEQVLDLYV